MFKNKGFTLIELITIMGIVAIIGTISTLTIVQTRNINLLDLTAKELVANLLDTQQKAIVQLESDSWGIYINTSGERDYYEVFHGDDYVGGTIVGRTSLPAKIEFVEPLQGETEEILFNKITGYPQNDHRLLLGLKGDTSETRAIRIVTIGEIGLVSLADTPLDPLAPQNLIAIADDSGVTLTWQAPLSNGGDLITGYAIYRVLSSNGQGATPTFTVGDILTYLDDTVSGGTTYYYKVKAINSAGESYFSNEASTLTPDPPTAPQNLSGSGSDSQASLTWQAPADDGGSSITNYKIYRGESLGGETFLDTIGNILSYSDNTAQNQRTYYYKVSAVSTNGGEGPLSNEATVPMPDIPGSPSNLVSTLNGNQVDLTWNPPPPPLNGSPAVSNYHIYRSTTPGSEELYDTIGDIFSYSDVGVSAGNTYYYQVSAENSIGEGVKSNEASTTATSPIAPAAPTLTRVTALNSRNSIHWQAPTPNGGPDITEYNIYRGETSGDETFLDGVGNVLTYLDTTSSNDTTYYYKIAAVNSIGEGSQSNEISGVPSAFNPAFITSAAYTGNLGGLSGADAKCQAAADNGNLGGTWGAWLSTYNISASSRLTHYTGPYKLINGTLIADSWADLTDGFIENPIDRDEYSNYHFSDVFSNTNTDGSSYNWNTCVDWTNDSGSEWSYYGQAYKTDSNWTKNGYYRYCYNQLRLYCFEKNVVDVPYAPQNLSSSTTVGQNSLTWSAPSYNGGSAITNYKIYRGTSPGNSILLTVLDDTTSYLDTGVDSGVTYYYQVSAVNSLGEGSKTSEISVQSVSVPSAPTLSVRYDDSNGDAAWLNWTVPSDGGSQILKYKIYRGTTLGEEQWQYYPNESNTFWTDSNISPNTTYYYKILAENAVGDGPFSNTVILVTEDTSYVFVTNDVYQGRYLSEGTGINGVNSKCSQAAASAGINYYNWEAWISDDGGSPSTRFSRPNHPYRLLNGVKIADDWDDLTDGSLNSPINVFENGTSYFVGHSGNEVWSNTLTDGTAKNAFDPSYNSCQNWWYGSYGQTGALDFMNGYWTDTNFSFSCSNYAHLYCFEQKISYPSAPQNVTAQRSVDQTQTTLTWDGPNSDGRSAITGYNIYRSTLSGQETLLVSLGNVFIYNDSGQNIGTTYYYKIKAVNSIGEGVFSNEVVSEPNGISTPPQNLNASGQTNQTINLNWSAPADTGGLPVTNYEIYRGSVSGSHALLATIGNTTSYSDTTAVERANNYYIVRAITSFGAGQFSSEVSAYPLSPPSAPTGLALSEGIAGTPYVLVDWADPSHLGGGTLAGFKIYRGLSAGSESLLVDINPDDTWNNWINRDYGDYSISDNTTYYYKVLAYNEYGNGLFTNLTSFTTWDLPSAPTNLSLEPGDRRITLTWQAPSDDGGASITGYKIYRGTSSGSESLIATINDLAYVNTGLTNGTTYYYKVSATNDLGEGAQASESSVPLATVPMAPTISAGPAYLSVDVFINRSTYDGGATITSYKLYRGTSAGSETLLATLPLDSQYPGSNLLVGTYCTAYNYSTSPHSCRQWRYNDNTAPLDVTNYYKVSAVNSTGESQFSSSVSNTYIWRTVSGSGEYGATCSSWLPQFEPYQQVCGGYLDPYRNSEQIRCSSMNTCSYRRVDGWGDLADKDSVVQDGYGNYYAPSWTAFDNWEYFADIYTFILK